MRLGVGLYSRSCVYSMHSRAALSFGSEFAVVTVSMSPSLAPSHCVVLTLRPRAGKPSSGNNNGGSKGSAGGSNGSAGGSKGSAGGSKGGGSGSGSSKGVRRLVVQTRQTGVWKDKSGQEVGRYRANITNVSGGRLNALTLRASNFHASSYWGLVLSEKPRGFRIVENGGNMEKGHTEAVLAVAFSPDSKQLASGSGDTTVRFWDVDTQTPLKTRAGHKNWVLSLAWSPDAKWLATGGMDAHVLLWESPAGEKDPVALKGHRKWITAIAWEPVHVALPCRRLASASRDGDVRVWDAVRRATLFILTGHTLAVTSLRWGGDGVIYSGSRDCTVRMWSAVNGAALQQLKSPSHPNLTQIPPNRTPFHPIPPPSSHVPPPPPCQGHGHWVNSLALSTDYALRTGAFDHGGVNGLPATDEERKVGCGHRRMHRWGCGRRGGAVRAGGGLWAQGGAVGAGGGCGAWAGLWGERGLRVHLKRTTPPLPPTLPFLFFPPTLPPLTGLYSYPLLFHVPPFLPTYHASLPHAPA
ncbi:unnamed protein product [Closterium sp. NIES-53]